MGRPTVMTPEVIALFIEAFSFGCTDREACCYAGVGTNSLYDYCLKYPEFSNQKEMLKDKPTMKAKRIVNQSLDTGDLNTANRVIDRKEGTKVNTVISGEIKTDNVFNFIGVSAKD